MIANMKTVIGVTSTLGTAIPNGIIFIKGEHRSLFGVQQKSQPHDRPHPRVWNRENLKSQIMNSRAFPKTVYLIIFNLSI